MTVRFAVVGREFASQGVEVRGIVRAAIFVCDRGWPRTTMLLITLGLATAGLIAVAVIGFMQATKGSDLASIGAGAFGIFLLGSFLSQWIANWLATQKPKR